MHRVSCILIGGLLVAVAAYACTYFAGPSEQRALASSEEPALAWLQGEYHLSGAQFSRVRQLHESYRPKCVKMCRWIDAKNAQLR
jgi:hypothetical protein